MKIHVLIGMLVCVFVSESYSQARVGGAHFGPSPSQPKYRAPITDSALPRSSNYQPVQQASYQAPVITSVAQPIPTYAQSPTEPVIKATNHIVFETLTSVNGLTLMTNAEFKFTWGTNAYFQNDSQYKSFPVCSIDAVQFSKIGFPSKKSLADSKMVCVTNWVAPNPKFRMVKGQLYDSEHSPLWATLDAWEGLGNNGFDDSGRSHKIIMSVRMVAKGNVILVDIKDASARPDTYGGFMTDYMYQYVRSVIVLNYPDMANVVTGGELFGKCMKTSNYPTPDGTILKAYDFGTQTTDPVPVVQWIRSKSTDDLTKNSQGSTMGLSEKEN